MEPIDFACRIDPAGLEQRVSQLDSLVPQVLGLRRDGLTLALAFPAEAARDVQAFVAEESKCCPFFSFEIGQIDQGLRLEIRTPPGAEAMLEALQAAFAGDDYEAAYVPPRARAVLAPFDQRSAHHDTLRRP